jgi:hypothetical protein
MMIALFMVLARDNPVGDVFWSGVWSAAEALGLPLDMVDFGWDQFFQGVG